MEETKTLIAAETAAGKPAFKAPVIAVYQFPPEKGIDADAYGNITDLCTLAAPCMDENGTVYWDTPPGC